MERPLLPPARLWLAHRLNGLSGILYERGELDERNVSDRFAGWPLKVDGIKKIEAGPAGGRVLFAADTKVDPAPLTKLIQTKPKEYKLDGGDKLRFFRDLTDPAQRIAQVGRVVEQLVG